MTHPIANSHRCSRRLRFRHKPPGRDHHPRSRVAQRGARSTRMTRKEMLGVGVGCEQEQCNKLRRDMESLSHSLELELIVVSPLTRTLQAVAASVLD